jgi:hypothetical protein
MDSIMDMIRAWVKKSWHFEWPGSVMECLSGRSGTIVMDLMRRTVAVTFLLLTVIQAGADGLSHKFAEVDRDKDGKPDVRTEVVSRNGVKQIVVMSRADESGEWKVTARSFYVGPHMAVTESDEDGDGFFEMVAVYREDPEDVNAFVRERDGAIRPAEVKMVEALRKQNALLTEFWSKPERDPEKMEAAIMEAQEKMKQIAEEAGKGD